MFLMKSKARNVNRVVKLGMVAIQTLRLRGTTVLHLIINALGRVITPTFVIVNNSRQKVWQQHTRFTMQSCNSILPLSTMLATLPPSRIGRATSTPSPLTRQFPTWLISMVSWSLLSQSPSPDSRSRFRWTYKHTNGTD